MNDTSYIFSQLHIDVARNSTDDFNLFHDSGKWTRINGNPFNSPIVLGFQLESLIEAEIAKFRQRQGEEKIIAEYGLNYSNYQFTFANAVKPGQLVEVEVKGSQLKTGASPMLSNRVVVRVDGGMAMIGFKKETRTPLFLADADLSGVPGDLRSLPDSSFLPAPPLMFLKRKFMTTSNAKNFLCGSQRDQSEYFDELQEKINFPEMFPCALLSSALLEKAVKLHHDFERNPMVFNSHKISVDRASLLRLRSTDALHILIRPADNTAQHDFGDIGDTPLDYECFGLVSPHGVLFRAIITLLPLSLIGKTAPASEA